jgi:hypothetical protein
MAGLAENTCHLGNFLRSAFSIALEGHDAKLAVGEVIIKE